jgi:hypothetical protein
VKGKDEDWYTSGTLDLRVLAFSFDGRYTEEAIRQKLIKLELLKEQQQPKNSACCCSSPDLELPKELMSIEETLKILNAALEALKKPGLDKSEVLRLPGIISGCKIYKELFADYAGYRSLEAELLELTKKYGGFKKKS